MKKFSIRRNLIANIADIENIENITNQYRRNYKCLNLYMKKFKLEETPLQISQILKTSQIYSFQTKTFTEYSTTIIIDTSHRIIAFFVYFKLVPITHSLSGAPLS